MRKEIRKLRDSFRYALRGLKLCIQSERNLRVHMTAAFYVILFSILGQASGTSMAVLCLCFGLTMGAELMNTAVERLCDKQASGYDEIVRNAKDIAAAAVLVCALACVAVGICIFLRNGVLIQALFRLMEHPFLIVALIVSLPVGWWFIFRLPAARRFW